jgi:hypothetical protein
MACLTPVIHKAASHPASRAEPPSIKLSHRLAKTTDPAAKWRLFEQEHQRFKKLIAACSQSIHVNAQGRLEYTPQARSVMRKLGCVYAHFFADVQRQLRNPTTEQSVAVAAAYRQARLFV